MAEANGVDIVSPVPSNDTLYDTGVGCVYAGENGDSELIATPPFVVTVKLFWLMSIKRLLWQVNKLVPGTAVNGLVLGIKLDVYNAVPLTIRRLEIYPGNVRLVYALSMGYLPNNPTANGAVELKIVTLNDWDEIRTPLTNP